jgi:hypothetical protein
VFAFYTFGQLLIHIITLSISIPQYPSPLNVKPIPAAPPVSTARAAV